MMQKTECIIERVSAKELGLNYRHNYIIEFDNVTKEHFIMDFTRKYKYVIVDDETNESGEFITYGYVTERELKLLDMKNFNVFHNVLKDEFYLQDHSEKNKHWLILPDDWDTSDENNFIAEDDVDLLEWTVHLDRNTNRKFIIDEGSGQTLDIIPNDFLDEFKKNWQQFYKIDKRARSSSLDLEKLDTNVKRIEAEISKIPTTITSETENPSQQKPPSYILYEYVTQDELESIDLLHIKINKDIKTGEYFILDPKNPNRRWVVLPKGWRKSDKDPYVAEEEVDPKKHKVFVTEFNRKYVRDTQNNMLFIVPNMKDLKQTFKHKWGQMMQGTLEKPKQQSDSLRNSKKQRSNSQSSPRDHRNEAIPISNLPGSPRPLHYLMVQQAMDKKRKDHEHKAPDNLERGLSASNDMLDRAGNYPKRPENHRINPSSPLLKRPDLVDAQINGYQKAAMNANSANSLHSSENEAVAKRAAGKKNVYFRETVEMSDGTIERQRFNQASIQGNNFEPRKLAELIPSDVKPIVKPLGVRLNSTDQAPKENNMGEMKPSADARRHEAPIGILKQNNRTNDDFIVIKQNGKPGHLIRK